MIALPFLVAASAAAGTTSWIDDGYPPARYEDDRTAFVQFVDKTQIESNCGKGDGGIVLACSFGTRLVLPNPCSPEFAGQSFARLACHEMGHANGWPGNHPRP